MAKKILVVDDEPEIVRAVMLLLRSKGYEVVVATDGIQAMQVAMKERPDLVILDISMPGGDGHTVCQRLQMSSRTAAVPVIILSARDTLDDLQRAQKEGACSYIKKPYNSRQLLHEVQKHLGELYKGNIRKNTPSL